MGNFVHDLIGPHTAQVAIPGHAAGDSTIVYPIWTAPFTAKVRSVKVRPGTAITGANTNTKHLNLQNGGVAGAATTELGNIDFVSGTDATLGEDLALYEPASPLDVAEGVLLKLEVEHVGTGQAIPPFVVTVEYEGA